MEAERIPKGYGIGYYDSERLEAWAYPIPFNKLVTCWFKFWYWLKSGDVDNAYTRGYRRGLIQGLDEGYVKGEQEYKDFANDFWRNQ